MAHLNFKTFNQKLLLFDIDGTLLSNPEFLKDYQRYLSYQSSKYFNQPTEINFTGLHGGTERNNLRILLKRQGIEPSERQMDEFFYIAGQNYAASAESLILLPNVLETIQKLSKIYILGVVTGNQETVARKRLDFVGLGKYFPFGSFGNESEDRCRLINLALDRARNYGWDGNLSNAYVIGDTPKDVESGKSAGAKTIAVTTGSGKREQLETSNPDNIIKNLSGLEAVLS